jgi:hypothetical protein
MGMGGAQRPFLQVNDSEKTRARIAAKTHFFLDYLPALTVQPIEGNQTMNQL